jgi:glyceraldehyde 3-phosphate dehydrogenase
VSISDIADVSTLAALFEVDSNYGRWTEDVRVNDSCFVIGGREIPYFDSVKDLPKWHALGVDVVIDCTGRATTRPGAQAHLDAAQREIDGPAPALELFAEELREAHGALGAIVGAVTADDLLGVIFSRFCIGK